MDALSAALHSVGTAATLVAAGAWLHRRGHVTVDTKKVLARYSQQIGTPALFFTKLVQCPERSDEAEECSSVMEHLKDAWILLVWPLYVVCLGMAVGWFLIRVFSVDRHHFKSVLAATAFANSNALPMTLLTVMYTSSPHDTPRQLDPNTLLAIYMILYPVLQWTIGFWLVSSDDVQSSPVPNSSLEMKPLHLQDDTEHDDQEEQKEDTHNAVDSTMCLSNTLSHALQPPVVGALSGLFIASIPWLRGLLVSGTGEALLSWWFQAMQTLANSAVPVNMAVLGVNMSLSAQSSDSPVVPTKTLAAVVFGKMVLLPALGLTTTTLLLRFWTFSSAIRTSITWVLLLEFCMPTATNVMVIVDVAGGTTAKQAMAQMIAWQYVVAPVILSLWVMCIVHLAA